MKRITKATIASALAVACISGSGASAFAVTPEDATPVQSDSGSAQAATETGKANTEESENGASLKAKQDKTITDVINAIAEGKIDLNKLKQKDYSQIKKVLGEEQSKLFDKAIKDKDPEAIKKLLGEKRAELITPLLGSEDVNASKVIGIINKLGLNGLMIKVVLSHPGLAGEIEKGDFSTVQKIIKENKDQITKALIDAEPAKETPAENKASQSAVDENKDDQASDNKDADKDKSDTDKADKDKDKADEDKAGEDKDKSDEDKAGEDKDKSDKDTAGSSKPADDKSKDDKSKADKDKADKDVTGSSKPAGDKSKADKDKPADDKSKAPADSSKPTLDIHGSSKIDIKPDHEALQQVGDITKTVLDSANEFFRTPAGTEAVRGVIANTPGGKNYVTPNVVVAAPDYARKVAGPAVHTGGAVKESLAQKLKNIFD